MKKFLPFLSLFLLYAGGIQAQLLHERRYQPRADYSTIMASAPDGQGNILYSGINFANLTNYNRYFLLAKPDADTLWTLKSPNTVYYSSQAIQALPKGGFITGGNIKNSSSAAILLQRMDAAGSIMLNKNYLPIFSYVTAMLPVGSDYLLGGGYGANKDFSIVRTDSLGTIKWVKNYARSIYDFIIDMQFTADGNILVVGTTADPVPSYHPRLLLLNQNGDSLLGRQLIVTGFTRKEVLRLNESSVTALSDGGFLFTADADTVKTGFPGGAVIGMVVKVDAGLNLVWKYVHRTAAIDEVTFTKSRELADGSVLVLSSRLRPSSNTFAVYHFDPFGSLLNIYPFTSNLCTDFVTTATLDVVNDSTFIVGGRCADGSTMAMYIATVRIPGLPAVLPTIVATKPELALAPNALGQSYPNPAQDKAIIPYHLPNGTKSAQILLLDITGRQVGSYSLKVQQKQDSLLVNLSSLHNGLYLYYLVLDGKLVATKKLAVAR